MKRTVNYVHCSGCGAFVLAGDDEDVAAYEAFVEAVSLSIAGELQAYVYGRRTFVLRSNRLYRRNAWQIMNDQSRWNDLRIEHDCANPVPAEWLAPARPEEPDEPPF